MTIQHDSGERCLATSAPSIIAAVALRTEKERSLAVCLSTQYPGHVWLVGKHINVG